MRVFYESLPLTCVAFAWVRREIYLCYFSFYFGCMPFYSISLTVLSFKTTNTYAIFYKKYVLL